MILLVEAEVIASTKSGNIRNITNVWKEKWGEMRYYSIIKHL